MTKEEKKDKGFLISATWMPAMKEIPTEELGRVIRMLMNYQLSEGKEKPDLEGMSPGTRPFCLCVIPQIDMRIAGFLNGKKGGRPRKTKESV